MKPIATSVIILAALSPVTVSRAQSPAVPSPSPAASAAAAPGPAAVAKEKKTASPGPKASAAAATPAAKATEGTSAAAAKETSPPGFAAATPQNIVVVTQPAAPAPPPGNNWGAGLLGLLILGVGGFFGLRYAQKRGVTVADSLQKLGVEMPQDGVNGPATISHLKPPPPQAAPLPPLPSLANLPEAAAVGSGVATARASAPAKKPGTGSLVGTLGPVEGKQISVPADAPLTMGRDTDNTLPMPGDTTVSRRHARIEASSEGSGFEIVDEGSSNGTYVNGQRLSAGQKRLLVVGDEIQVGASRLRFEG